MLPGELGQYDVVVDGRVVTRRKRTVLHLLLKTGWPSAEDVLRGIEDRRARSRDGH